MKLSVILPTRNRAELLQKALDSLLRQSFSQNEFEIIVADNGSTDGTRALCDAFKKKFIYFKYIYDGTPGLHVGRHRGLKEAASDILVYADDDIQALPTWLEAIWTSFQDPTVMLVGGNNYPLYEKDPPVWVQRLWADSKTADGYCIGYFSVLDFGATIKSINPNYVYGCNFSIRKKNLLEAGGFHPDGMPQELIRFRGDGETAVSDYILKKNYKAQFNPQASIKHNVPKERMTLRYLRARSFNQGISDSYTALRNSYPCKTVKANNGHMRTIVNNTFKSNGFAVLRRIKNMLSDKLNNNIYQQMQAAREAGYKFHQAEYLKDQELRNWVHRADYYAS